MQGGRSNRRFLLLALVLGAFFAWPASSQAFVACTFSGGQVTVDLTSYDDAVTLQRFGDQVAVVTGYDPEILVPCNGGTPTVTNTDSVLIREGPHADEDEVTIDLSEGPLAPGATAEADGTSEIEVAVQMNGGREESVYVEGTDAPETFRLGTTSAGATGINVNAGSEPAASADSDIDLTGASQVVLFSEGGADSVNAQGGPGFAAPVRDLVLIASGGSGPDQLVAGDASSILAGGGAKDMLAGSSKSDFLAGGAAKDTILAGRGGDQVIGLDGKTDRIQCGAGKDSVLVDRSDRHKGCEKVRIGRVRHGRRPPDFFPFGV